MAEYMETEYLKKPILKIAIKSYFKNLKAQGKHTISVMDANADINRIIGEIPAADVAPVKHGHRVDCSQTLNYAKEHNRMCEKYFVCPDACAGCPMAEYNCSEPNDITQEHIDILQKWSDENPPEAETP